MIVPDGGELSCPDRHRCPGDNGKDTYESENHSWVRNGAGEIYCYGCKVDNTCAHEWSACEDGKALCGKCGYKCGHIWTLNESGAIDCPICGFANTCEHDWYEFANGDRMCLNCKFTCTHVAESVSAVPATCAGSGLTEGSRCTVCGATVIAQQTVPATGIHHLDESGSCATCRQEFTTEGLTVLELPVKTETIMEEAFSGIAAEVIIVPDMCTSIGSHAFADCPNLKYIFLPKSVETIAEDAFEGCTAQLIYR